MNNKAIKTTLTNLYRDAITTNLNSKKLNKALVITMIAGFIFAGVSANMQKEKERKMEAFTNELDKLDEVEGDTTCND